MILGCRGSVVAGHGPPRMRYWLIRRTRHARPDGTCEVGGITTVIPEKSDQVRARKNKGSAGGRPPGFGAQAYKGRNVVERAFNTVKQWRGLATRYDKLAVVYRAAAVLSTIVAWLSPLGDTP